MPGDTHLGLQSPSKTNRNMKPSEGMKDSAWDLNQ